MYIPKHFIATNREEIISFMKKYNFATIVTADNGLPVATHLPFVVEERDGEIFLSSHFAIANPQAEQMIKGKALVIFSEPHAYISPKYYNKKQNVPTWNYIAVHAYGDAEIISGEANTLALLEKMIDAHDAEYKNQWNELPLEYKTCMAKGIVAFEFRVSELQAKNKLSQNNADDERMRVVEAFERDGSESERAISEYMKKEFFH